jgi:hypothetical protein
VGRSESAGIDRHRVGSVPEAFSLAYLGIKIFYAQIIAAVKFIQKRRPLESPPIMKKQEPFREELMFRAFQEA